MRTVTFEILPGTGPDAEPTRGTVADLLLRLPYVLSHRVVPALAPLNDLLRRGVLEAGMSGGCRWEPFEMDEAEWRELRAALEAEGCRWVEPPWWVADWHDWHAWLFEHRHGVPAQEHRRLIREDDELGRALAEAAARGDQAAVEALQLKRLRVGERLSTLLMKHLQRRS